MFDPFFIFEAISHWYYTDKSVDKNMVKLQFIGEISEELRKILISNNLIEISEITGFKSHHDAIQMAKQADVLLLSLGLSSNTPRGWIPSKNFEYIALNKPIVASVVEGEAAKLIRQTESGFVISNRDLQKNYDILHKLYQMKMENENKKIEWENNEKYAAQLRQHYLIPQLGNVLNNLTTTIIK